MIGRSPEHRGESGGICTVWVFTITVLIWLQSAVCSPRRSGDPEPEVFLEKYGYLHQDNHIHDSAELQLAVREFQWLSRLPVTGMLDSATLRQMAEPRCGVRDARSHQVWAKRVNAIFTGRRLPLHRPTRKKRYASQGEKWYKHHLTYRIVNWPRHLSPGPVRLAVRAAFQLWSNVSGLVFQEVPEGPTDIRLAFYEGEHNDGASNAFDGPGGALAHAFFPCRGEAHFDMAERWTLNGHKGHNLFMVTAHEIGHTLGLEHSPVRHALMSPYYRKLGRALVLSWDDITAVQQLYGKPLGTGPVRLPGQVFTSALQQWELAETPSGASGGTLPLFCQGLFDAITMDDSGTVLVFRGSVFWTISAQGDVSPPLPLRQRWPLLPLAIEAAAFTPLDSKWFFFKGMLSFNTQRLLTFLGELRDILNDREQQNPVPAQPPPIYVIIWNNVYDQQPYGRENLLRAMDLACDDVAVGAYPGWVRHARARMWRYTSSVLDPGFPKKSSEVGLPHHPDCAFYYPPLGHLVLFKGSRYSVFNLDTLRSEPYYPRRLSDWTGVPRGTNGALTRPNGRLYLFREQRFWRFDPGKVRVTREGQWAEDLSWTGCQNATRSNDIL